MPTFYNSTEMDTDITVDEFLDACDSDDKQEIINALIEDGYIKHDDLVEDKTTVNEQSYESMIYKLHGKYFSLTQEEEAILSKIASRF
jgi:hypothetical protein